MRRNIVVAVARVIVPCLMLLACDPPKFSNPLSNPQTAKADPRLVGIWNVVIDGKHGTLTVVPNAGATVDLVFVAGDGEKGAFVIGFNAFPTALDGKTYLNMRGKRWVGSDKTELDKEWLIVRYEVTRPRGDTTDTLALWIMQDDEIKAAIAAGRLRGKVETKMAGDVHVTSDTSVVANFVKNANDAKLFRKYGGSFRRQR